MSADAYTLDEEGRGLALASQALVFSLTTVLRNKGVISDAEMTSVVEMGVQSLEHYAPDEASVRFARELLDQIGQIVSGHPKSQH